MGLEKEIKVSAKISNPEGGYGPGKVECKTVNGEVLIDTIRENIETVTRNDSGIFDVTMKNNVEWVTGHNPQGALAEALTSDQANLNRLMAEAFAVATVGKFYENSDSGIPENITAAEHEIVGEIAFRLAKNPWHDAEKFKKLNLHTDITKSLNWVSENAGESKKSYSWFMIPMGGMMVACNPVMASAPAAEVAPLPSSVAENPTDVNVAVVSPTPEAQVTPTEIKYIIGAGGELTASQKGFMNSEEGKKQQKGMSDYFEYYERTGYLNPAEVILTPIVDADRPRDPRFMILGCEIPGKEFEGKKCFLPFFQFNKYLNSENRDPGLLTPPQGNELMPYTDLFWVSTEVTKDSAPEKAGIPLGSVFAYKRGSMVYLDKNTQEVVGVVDEETGMWKKYERYAIDLEKVHHPFPKSYAEFAAQSNEYQEFHNPETDMEAYKNDWNELKKALGKESDLPRNVRVSSINTNEFYTNINIDKKDEKPIYGDVPSFYYINSQGEKVFCPIFSLEVNEGGKKYSYGTYAIMIVELERIDGVENSIIEKLARGEKIRGIIIASKHGTGFETPLEEMLINNGIDGIQREDYYQMGVGDILTTQ